MSDQRVQKKKMATIREVYDRILWDARLDRSAFAIGYTERMSIGVAAKNSFPLGQRMETSQCIASAISAAKLRCDREIRFQTMNLVVTLHSPSIGRTCNL
jgi:uncharacterized protein (UPF0248 family)